MSVVPPVEGPKLGSQNDTNGPAPAAACWNAIEIVAEPVCPFEVAEARTTATPGNSEQSAVRAAPFCVTTEISGSEFWAKTPKSVEKETPVPSATGEPFSVTIAWMSVHVPAGGFGLLVNNRIWSALVPVVPPPGPPPGLGGVGASDEQPKAPATSTRTVRVMAIRRMKASVMSCSRPLETSNAREQEDSRRCLALDPVSRCRLAEESEIERHLDRVSSGLPIHPSVERQKLIERRLLEVGRSQDREVVEHRRSPGGNEDPHPEGLGRGDDRSAVGAAKPHRVAVDLGIGETLRIGRSRVLQMAGQRDRGDLHGRRRGDVDESGLHVDRHRDEDGRLALPLLVGTRGRGADDENGHRDQNLLFHGLSSFFT